MFSCCHLTVCRFYKDNSINLSRFAISKKLLLIEFFSISVSIENEEFDVVPLTPEKVLELIEQAYPNPITPDDLAR